MALQRLGEARLDFLDQMRALAIASVMLSHFHSDWLPGGGAAGVGIFFSLSGFLIASILLEEDRFDPAVAVRFIIRRFARIYPAYLAAVLATVALTYFYAPEKLTAILSAVPGILTFTQEAHSLGYAFLVLWTLQVEMAFYLVVPIAMLILGRGRGLLAVLIVLTALSVAALFGLTTSSPVQIYAGDLAFGALVSLAWKHRWLDRLPGKSPILAGAALAGIVVVFLFSGATGLEWMIQIMAASLCGCVLIVAFLRDPALPVAPLLPWIGRISYSIYLIHGIVLDFRIAPELIWERFYSLGHLRIFADGMTFIVVVIGLSALSYRWIERPGMKAGKRLASALFRSRPALSGAR